MKLAQLKNMVAEAIKEAGFRGGPVDTRPAGAQTLYPGKPGVDTADLAAQLKKRLAGQKPPEEQKPEPPAASNPQMRKVMHLSGDEAREFRAKAGLKEEFEAVTILLNKIDQKLR